MEYATARYLTSFQMQVQQINDTILIRDDDEKQFIPLELFGIITQLQCDMMEVKKKQAIDSIVLESVRSDVNSVLVLFRTIHGTLNSLLSRVGLLSQTITQGIRLQHDCDRMETTLTEIHTRLCSDEQTPQRNANTMPQT